MARWTRLVLRFRWPILAFWLLVLLAGGFATSRLPGLLSNTFTVPGTDSERARTILQQHFGDRSDGEFLVVYRTPSRPSRADLGALQAGLVRAARVVPSGRAGPLVRGSGTVWYG